MRPDFYPNSFKEPLPMSHFASPKTAQIWAERIAQCERSNAPVAQFCQSIGCSPIFSPRGVVQRDLGGRRTSSPSPKSYSAYDGLPVRRPRRSGGSIDATDFQSVVQGDQNVNSLQRLKQPPFCVCKHRIPTRTPSRSNSPRESLSWFLSRPLNPSLRSSRVA